MSKVYRLKVIQRIPADIDAVWNFFSKPDNLKDITPVDLNLKVISEQFATMYAGQVIEYKVKPLLGIPIYWMTEIMHVKDKEYFVDEQRYGPYSLWHHQHHFKIIEGGVEMTDIVHYKIPYLFIGDIANALFVKTQLEKIFSFRYAVVQERFGKWPGEKNVVCFDK